jgi:phosphoribosylglycinamide formyltransferase-1
MTKRVAVFISGRGSNLKSLIEQAKEYKICAILSNRSDAPGLELGAQFGIPVFAVDRLSVSSVTDQKSRLYQAVREIDPDLIALAGYMQILDASFVNQYYGKIVNIHPSLLPKLTGLYGSTVHQQALAQGFVQHGCTVHYVDAGVDTGPIIAQMSCDVLSGDTVESLAARVLKLEHQLYPWVVNGLAQGSISLRDKLVCYSAALAQNAAASNIQLRLA